MAGYLFDELLRLFFCAEREKEEKKVLFYFLFQEELFDCHRSYHLFEEMVVLKYSSKKKKMRDNEIQRKEIRTY